MNNTQEALIQAVVSDYVKETGDKNPDEKKLQNYIKQKGGDKYLQQKLQSLTQKAAHGTKLQYIKNLKNQCADDEELVYFKKGGSLGCGCVKKGTEGMEFNNNPKNKQNTKPTWTKEDDKKLLEERRKGIKNGPAQKKWNNLPPEEKKKYQLEEGKKGMKVEKDCGGSTVIAKFKAAKCGAKMKKHEQGGSLNGVPFMQQGKNLPTAPKAEDRYRGGQRVSVETKGGRYGGNDRMEIKEVQGKKPGMFGSVPFIRQTVLHSTVSPDYNDTTYIEVPERKNFLVERKLRGVEKHPSVFKTYYSNVHPFFGSILPDLGSGTKEEYETLKRRFNTAWNLAK